jgi:hypothetical protein
MTVMPEHKATPHPVLGWNFEDIGTAVEALRDRGVAFPIYEAMGSGELGIWTSPGGKARSLFSRTPMAIC